MTPAQKNTWQAIISEIYTAFHNVTLEDGIGYFEAEAIDDYVAAGTAAYAAARAKDERADWRALLPQFQDVELDSGRFCFMDGKGLRFYLPFLMVRRDSTLNSVLHFYISAAYERAGYSAGAFGETYALLTPLQRHCVYRFYAFVTELGAAGFECDELNSAFDCGEEAMRGFDFMAFIASKFKLPEQ